MWPGEGVVENIDWCIGKILGLDDLDEQRPSRIVPSLNRIEQIFDMIIGFFPSQSQGLFGI